MTGIAGAVPEPAAGRDGAGAQETAGKAPSKHWDPLIRVAGIVVSIVATLVTALIELELSTLRTSGVAAVLRGDSPWTSGGVPLPLAIPVAIGANLLICWFVVSTTGRRWALGPPWALWTLLMLAAAGTRTVEGDYLLSGDNWVALVMILAGSLTFAVYSYKMILKPVGPPRPAPQPVGATPEASPVRTGN